MLIDHGVCTYLSLDVAVVASFGMRYFEPILALIWLAYKAYVRPVLEYSSEVWSPYLLKHINAIENVQLTLTEWLFSIL